VGALNLFAIVGALCASLISDQLGRRGAFAVAAVGFIVGVGLEYSASSYGWLMFGRVFVGLGVGFGLAIDPVCASHCLQAAPNWCNTPGRHSTERATAHAADRQPHIRRHATTTNIHRDTEQHTAHNCSAGS
jgi:MFS family permease